MHGEECDGEGMVTYLRMEDVSALALMSGPKTRHQVTRRHHAEVQSPISSPRLILQRP